MEFVSFTKDNIGAFNTGTPSRRASSRPMHSVPMVGDGISSGSWGVTQSVRASDRKPRLRARVPEHMRAAGSNVGTLISVITTVGAHA